MPKVKKSKGEKAVGAAVGLADQILQTDTIRARGRVKIRDSRAEREDEYVDERLSRKILQQARIQQEELQTEHGQGPEKKKIPTTVLGRYNHDVISYFGQFFNQGRSCGKHRGGWIIWETSDIKCIVYE